MSEKRNIYIYIYILILVIITLLLLFNNKQHYNNINNTKSVLVLYTFHKYDKNVQYFIDHAVFYDDDIDFIFIINDPNLKIDCPNYVKIINRNNIGYDFGAWSEGLLTNDLYKNYNKFIFVNSSVIGPILPSYYKGNWTDVYLNGLKNNIKLYGSTINSYPNSHVQSYAYCTDREGLELLINKEIFSMTNQISNYDDVVYQKEIRMSTEVLNNNWNIGCIFIHYSNINFNNINSNINLLGDLTKERYYTETIHPYELIFVKDKYIENKQWINNYIL